MGHLQHMLALQLRALKDLFVKAFRILNARQKQTYATSLLFMFVSSILELFTLGLLIPFITALVSPGTFAGFTFFRSFIPFLDQSSQFHPAAIFGIIVLALFIIKNIVSYYLYAYYNKFVYSIAADISRDKIYEYYRFHYPEYQKSNTAEMLREIAFIPVEFSQHIILGSMIIISELMLVGLCAAAMAVIQFRIFILTVCTLLPFVAVAWIVSVRYLRLTRRTIQQRSASNLRTLSDSLSAYQEVKLYHKEAFFSERYTDGQHELNLHLGKLNAANAIPGRLSEIFALVGLMLILFFYFRTGEHLTTSIITVLTVFVAFTYRMIPSFNKILNAFVHLHTYSFTVDLIAPVRASEPLSDKEKSSKSSELQFQDMIEMRYITFGYPGQAIPILRNLSLQIHKSDFIGIVGRSGLGKTSLLRVLLQLVPQTSGDITIDGKVLDESDLLSWQNLFCYVAQDPVILSDSIKSNIAFGVPDSKIDIETVNAILQKVGLYEVIQQMPNGIDSIIEERGNNLSGGQKQRLVIARALYRNAEIFIFDEALNELDKASEQELFEIITSLHRSGKTIIMISHHYQPIALCKAIYSLRNGRLHKAENLTLSQVQE